MWFDFIPLMNECCSICTTQNSSAECGSHLRKLNEGHIPWPKISALVPREQHSPFDAPDPKSQKHDFRACFWAGYSVVHLQEYDCLDGVAKHSSHAARVLFFVNQIKWNPTWSNGLCSMCSSGPWSNTAFQHPSDPFWHWWDGWTVNIITNNVSDEDLHICVRKLQTCFSHNVWNPK